jgi:hypothetical protein
MIKFHALFRHSYQANSNLVRGFLIEAAEKGELRKVVYEGWFISNNTDYALVGCKILESKYLKQYSIHSSIRDRLIFQNSNENYFRFYTPLSTFSFDSKSSLDHMMSWCNYLCDYKNCKE